MPSPRDVGICVAEEDFHALLTSELEALKSKLLIVFDRVARGAVAPQTREHTDLVDSQDSCAEFMRVLYELDQGCTYPSDDGNPPTTEVAKPDGDTRQDIVQSQVSKEATDETPTRGQYDSQSSVCSAEPRQFLTLCEYWELDRATTMHRISDAHLQSSEAMAQKLTVAEQRVIQELRTSRVSDGSCEQSAANGGLVELMAKSATMEWGDRQFQKPLVNYFRCELPLNPFSNRRMIWDLVGLIFVIYDIVMMPFVQMVLQQPSSFDNVVSLVSNIFWSLDIVLTFLTAAVQQDKIVTDWAGIAQRYARSWLFLDLLMVLPEWVCMALDSGRAGFALLRILKMFRAMRLLRMIKMESVLRRQLKRVNSESLLHVIQLLKLIFAFLMLNHLIACSWYFIGHTMADGWLEMWVVAKSSSSIGEAYLLALHWSITQFHGSMNLVPGNAQERLFAVVVLIIGMLTFSIFLSVITNILFSIRQVRRQVNEQQSRLRSYFTRHKVSMQMMLCVKAHFRLDKDFGKACLEDKELLQALPEQLARSLVFEVHQPIIGKHWLFKWLRDMHCTALRDICYCAFTAVPALKGLTIFEHMDACTQMLFVDSGMLRYIVVMQQQKQKQRTSVSPNGLLKRSDAGIEICASQWICEPALWVKAWHSRGKLLAMANSVLLCLEGSRFAQVLTCYPSVHFDVMMYARWALQEFKDYEHEQMLDLWKPTTRRERDAPMA